jgi:hypothetical protein
VTDSGARDAMGLALTTNAELVSRVLHGAGRADGASVMAAVSATRTLDVILNDILRALVRQARAEGRTWAEIGEVLQVTRQAAFQRFGAPARAGEDRNWVPPSQQPDLAADAQPGASAVDSARGTRIGWST